MPTVVLRTTGARTGEPRDVPLGYFTGGDDRARLYALAEGYYSGYTTYALNTDGVRTIPVMRLTPVDAVLEGRSLIEVLAAAP